MDGHSHVGHLAGASGDRKGPQNTYLNGGGGATLVPGDDCGEVRSEGNRITAHELDEPMVDLVRLGHGLDPVGVVREDRVNHGVGIPGLEGAMIACATERRGGRRLEIISLSELGSRVLSLHTPQIQERWYAEVGLGLKKGYFLLDSGATTSMITSRFYNSMSNPPPIIPSDLWVTVADGYQIHCRGLVICTVTVGGRKYAGRVLVMDRLGGNEDGILGLDFMYTFDCTMSFRTGKFSLEDGASVVWASPETKCLGARLETSVLCRPKEYTRIPLRPPQGEATTWAFKPSGHMCSSLSLGGSDGVISSEEPSVWMWNNSASAVRVNRNECMGVVESCEVVDIDDVGEELLCNYEDEIGEDRLYPDVMPPEIECPLTKLIMETDLETPEQEEAALKLLHLCKVAFALPGEELGRADRVVHKIDTGDALPIKQAFRSLPFSRREEATRQIQDMMRRSVIERSKSPWASPIVMVKKKDGTTRFCIDYRRLNAVTKKNSYPLPLIEECVASLGGAQWFCTLDLESGYWQIGMDEASKEHTAFTSHLGLFQFKVMSFGLCNAPATFQCMMDDMLEDLRLEGKCLVYLDDVVVYAKTFDQMLGNLQEVLGKISSYGLKLKPKKCKLFKREVEYLGRIVGRDGVKPDPAKVKTVVEWPRPQTVKEVRQFLGFASYYRDFQPCFAGMVYPLQKLITVHGKSGRHHARVSWSEECEKAFLGVKRALTSEPVLGYPQGTGRFILDTDASSTGIAGVLSQEQGGKEVVLQYASNGLSARQRNYCTTKRELLAVVVYLNKFSKYLLDGNYMVRTDHSSLRWLLHFKKCRDMLARWLCVLEEYNLEDHMIQHRAGRLHVNADALSRLNEERSGRRVLCGNESCADCTVLATVKVAAVLTRAQRKTNEEKDGGVVWEPRGEMQKAQEKDENVNELRKLVMRGAECPTGVECFRYSKEFKNMLRWYDDYVMVEDVLKMRWTHKASGKVYYRVVLPASLREEFFDAFHGTKLTGHYGEDRIGMSMKSRYYWPGMGGDISRWLKACEVCLRYKDKKGGGKERLKKELHGEKWSRVAMDIIGPFPESEWREDEGKGGNKYCLVVIDMFTKWAEGYPMRCHTAPVVADALVSGWFSQHRQPDSLQSDRGAEFVGEVLECLSGMLDYEKLHTLSYRPQSNGQVERMNRTLLQQLSCMCGDKPRTWDQMIPHIFSAYRCCVQKSTGQTPYMMVYGEERKLPVDLQYETQRRSMEFPCAVGYIESMRQNIRFASEFARKKLGMVAVYQKGQFDNRARPRRFEVDDVVFRFSVPDAQQKIGAKWDGPYVVVSYRNGTFVLKTATGYAHVHVDYLRPWLNRGGMIRTSNLFRAEEFQTQLGLGIEILVIGAGGKISPGKDCPERARKMFELLAAKSVATRKKNTWGPVKLTNKDMKGRVWEGDVAGERKEGEGKGRTGRVVRMVDRRGLNLGRGRKGVG